MLVTRIMITLYCRDLLDSNGDDLEVRLGKQGTHVHRLSEWRVETVDEALELFARGQGTRQVASNNVNEHSSRSHLVILVKVGLRSRLIHTCCCDRRLYS